jgi:hypothetical protein
MIDHKSVGKISETSRFEIPNVSPESVHRYTVKGEKTDECARNATMCRHFIQMKTAWFIPVLTQIMQDFKG